MGDAGYLTVKKRKVDYCISGQGISKFVVDSIDAAIGSKDSNALPSNNSPVKTVSYLTQNGHTFKKSNVENEGKSFNGDQIASFSPLLKKQESRVMINGGKMKIVTAFNPPKSFSYSETNGFNAKMVTLNPSTIALKMPSGTFLASKAAPKVIMSTVAKRVPLISTMPGNVSKVPPLIASIPGRKLLVASSATTSVVSTTISSASATSSSTSMSILEARLTAPKAVSMTASSSGSTNNVVTTSCSLPILSSKLPGVKKSNIILTPIVSADTATTAPEGADVVSRSRLGGAGEEGEQPQSSLKNPDESKTLQTQVQAVLSYERGLTRLVAVKSRTVTMIDVGMQVLIPQSEGDSSESLESSEASKRNQNDTHVWQHPVLPSVISSLSKGTSGVEQLSPSGPLKPGQLVTLNTKSGKVVVAVPKHILNSPTVPKTVLIGGKPVKIQMRGPLGHVVKPLSVNSEAEPSVATVSASENLRQTLGSFSKLHHFSTSSDTVSVRDVECSSECTSLTTETMTTPSSQAQSSIVTTGLGTGSPMPYHIISPPRSPIQVCKPSTAITSSNVNREVMQTPNSSPQNLEKVELGKRMLDGDRDSPPSKVRHVERSNQIDGLEGCERSSLASPSLGTDFVDDRSYHEDDASNDRSEVRDENNSPSHRDIEYSPLKGSSQIMSSFRPWSSMATIMKTNTDNSCVSPTENTESSVRKESVNSVIKNAFNDFKNCLNPNEEGNMPIHAAVEEGDFVAVKRQCIVLLARGLSIDLCNRRDETPLQLALYCGVSSIVKLLLNYKADGTFIDKEGNTALHLAVLFTDSGALEALLSTKEFSKESLNSLNDEGFAPLHLAAHHDKVKDLKLLVKYGCDVNLPDGKSGRTALYHAVERKHYKSQHALIELGADIKEPTFVGTTPLGLTKSDLIAQLTSGQHHAEVIDRDSLLMSPSPVPTIVL